MIFSTRRDLVSIAGNWVFGALTALSISVGLSGCFGSSKGGNVLDGRLNEDGNPPFTEAIIEYPGPAEKWAGPQSLMAHLSAQGGRSGEITVSHAGFKLSEFHPLISIEQAREQLDRIHSVVNHELKGSPQCSSPVKIRLIRTDGALISKQACRGQSGWPRVASDLTAQWMGLSFVSAEKAKGVVGEHPSKK